MILVTGGSGLLGSELISQLLAAGKAVRALYNTTPLQTFNAQKLEKIQCNILDVVGLEDAMKGVEQVYHCAAMISFNPAKRREMFRVNVEGTANIVNVALESGIKKLVHVSSVAALGRLREDHPVNEKMNWTEETSNSKYGQSKYLAELEVWRGIAEGLEAVIINPVIILGAGDWENGSVKIFRSVYDELKWYTEGVTGFVDVQDVAKSMIALMETNIRGERFIISSDNYSYRTVFNLIAKAFDRKPPYKKVTPGMVRTIVKWEAVKNLFTGKEPLVTRETAITAMAKVNFDNSKLKEYLPGFVYSQIEETIARTCASLQQKINKP